MDLCIAEMKLSKAKKIIYTGLSMPTISELRRAKNILILFYFRFGVCCVFLVSDSGSNINQNCTYIRNPGFPQAYSATTGVQYTINKCANSESTYFCIFRCHIFLFTFHPRVTKTLNGHDAVIDFLPK